MTIASRPTTVSASRADARVPPVERESAVAFERTRRMRASAARRSLVRETRLSPAQLVMPLFVVTGRGRREPIASMPGQARLSPDLVVELAGDLASLGVGGVMLFGVPDAKDPDGGAAADPAGPVPEAIRGLRAAGLQLTVAADVCLCEYTTHGHCGIVAGDRIDNDATLPRLADAAVAYAAAGADIVAPSGMMDGQVAVIRAGLDAAGLVDTAILAYASKHASALYGPFRDAADSTPAFGDRRSHQMDPGTPGRRCGRWPSTRRRAPTCSWSSRRSPRSTCWRGPGSASICRSPPTRSAASSPCSRPRPNAAGSTGGGPRSNSLTAIARAGADIILTYLARDAASWLAEETAR